MISYSLDNSGIFKVAFSGKVSSTDIENYLYEFEKLDNLPDHFLALYDMRHTDLKLTFEDLQRLSEVTQKVTATFSTVKTAFLVTKPGITALTCYFNKQPKWVNTNRKVFSTIDAAMKWLYE